ncbi:putative Phosphoglycerate dehydrogenase [Zostera marina]|uniref:Putative Phosphoglycerate dehydrogenase n=1 Tax=Zostera marina TaxID=29655 RepID=A0A0K9Q1P4_ZOSMR|nr:putative Phosphoglycerate dehydrogenase [Zostera marina]
MFRVISESLGRVFRGVSYSQYPSSLQLPRRRFLVQGYLNRMEKMTTDNVGDVTRVLFCGFHFPASGKFTREYLESYPFIQVDEVHLDDVPNVIGNYHICVVKNRHIDSKIIARAKEMKLIMQYGVGLEGVDVDAATQHGIKVARIPGRMTGNSTSCAEMAIYLMLGLLRKQKELEISIKEKRLGEPCGETLLGKTVFIMGFGAIGTDVAKRLKPFGVKIIATKRKWGSQLNDSIKSLSTVESDEIDSLVDVKGGHEKIYDFAREADIVAVCLLMNSETSGTVDHKFLSSMKKGSLLVNVSRGGILDYKSILRHLETGHLGGLGIDVAWTEPFDPNDPVLQFKNVLITPHVAGVTEFSYRTMAKVVGDCALQIHDGVPLTGVEVVNE